MEASYSLVCFMLNLAIRPQGSMILPYYMDNNDQNACLFILFVSYDLHLLEHLNILDVCKTKKFLWILNMKKLTVFKSNLIQRWHVYSFYPIQIMIMILVQQNTAAIISQHI